MRKRLSLAAVTVSLALSVVSQANAAAITWNAATTISGVTDVSTTGILLGAVGWSPGFGAYTATINGVTFTGVEAFSDNSFGVFSWSFIGGGISVNPPDPPFSALSADYRLLLTTGSNDGTTLTMSGLALGTTYEFQWWSNFSSSSVGTTATATAGNAITLDSNVSGLSGGLGQFSIGTFVADGPTQAVSFTSRVNGFQLRQVAQVTTAPVPEPATLSLLGLGLVGAAVVRYRRRR